MTSHAVGNQDARPPATPGREPSRFVNRELSWLEFNRRVLDEARDDGNPLLERLKFLAITASNLDEFFMVRVGGLQMLDQRGTAARDPSGMTAREQLDAIDTRVRAMVADQYASFADLDAALADRGIRRMRMVELSSFQLQAVQRIFDENLLPVLTPMAMRTEQPPPMLAAHMLHLGVRLSPAADAPDEPRLAIIPFGRSTSRFVTLPADGGYAYMTIEDVVGEFAEGFFPGERIEETAVFRITRNADLSVREDMAGDLLAGMENVLDARRESACVRLEIDASASDALCDRLRSTLGVPASRVHRVPGPLDLSAFMRLAGLSGFDELRFEPWPPQPSPAIEPGRMMFETLADRDVLLYHPFESFEPVVRFIQEAADDPDVLAIKQVLYRTSRESPVVAALRRAAESGKYVTAVVELKARFDEARNIEWARDLERASVQVIYGVKGLKTHAKVCVVVRREPHGIRRYVHYGTGNYNEVTARLYTDASLLTCDEDLGADATAFFNAVCGYSQLQPFEAVEAAPLGLRTRLLELIDAERQRVQQGQRGRIIAKINSLADPAVIDALYAASQAGVQIDLNVRGICCLRPGVDGLSERITVTSIVDRFLEHSRILYFRNGGDDLLFISSADWMPRNLDRRVELLVPVRDADARARLMSVLEACLEDTVKGRRIRADGGYDRPAGTTGTAGGGPMSSQELLHHAAQHRSSDARRTHPVVLEPHRRPD